MPDSNKLNTLDINDFFSSKVYNLSKDMNLSSLKVIENNLYGNCERFNTLQKFQFEFCKNGIKLLIQSVIMKRYNSNIYDLRISLSSDYSFGDQSSPGKWNLCWPSFYILNQNQFNQVNKRLHTKTCIIL